MSERIEQLTAEVSKRERTILSLENQKESMSSQMKNKEQSLDDAKNEILGEKKSLVAKIEEMKSKYDSAMDELTQNKINAEREKALKDQTGKVVRYVFGGGLPRFTTVFMCLVFSMTYKIYREQTLGPLAP